MGGEGPEDHVGVVAEVRSLKLSRQQLSALFLGIRQAVTAEHGVNAVHIALVKQRTIPKTVSGSICRQGIPSTVNPAFWVPCSQPPAASLPPNVYACRLTASCACCACYHVSVLQTSGKIRRSTCRESLLAGKLTPIPGGEYKNTEPPQLPSEEAPSAGSDLAETELY